MPTEPAKFTEEDVVAKAYAAMQAEQATPLKQGAASKVWCDYMSAAREALERGGDMGGTPKPQPAKPAPEPPAAPSLKS